MNWPFSLLSQYGHNASLPPVLSQDFLELHRVYITGKNSGTMALSFIFYLFIIHDLQMTYHKYM